MTKHNLGEIWKDSFSSKYPWALQMPHGIYPCKTKREALRVKETFTLSDYLRFEKQHFHGEAIHVDA